VRFLALVRTVAHAGVLTRTLAKSRSAGETAYGTRQTASVHLLPTKSGQQVVPSHAQAPCMCFSLSIRYYRCIRSRKRTLQVCLEGEAEWAPCEKTGWPPELVTSPDAGFRGHAVPHHPTAAIGSMPCTLFATLSRRLGQALLIGGRLQLQSNVQHPMAIQLIACHPAPSTKEQSATWIALVNLHRVLLLM
jgi:hypothetical protein